jgi:hypothetical protein
MGHEMAQWLRHCATNRKVAGLIPDSVIGIFHQHNPSGRTMALGSTHPLTEMSTRNISWGKGGWYVGLTTLPPSCANCLKTWEPQPPGTLRACNGIALPFLKVGFVVEIQTCGSWSPSDRRVATLWIAKAPSASFFWVSRPRARAPSS